MKKALLTLMCLTAMIVVGTSLWAQEVTIILNPGWTWISYPRADTLEVATALGAFTPMEGDIIKSQYGFSTYSEGQWSGSVQQFYPGLGYKYYSTRYVPTTLVFGGSASQPQVFVTTSEPMLITAISAMGGGEVTVGDGTYILVRGLCWATHENPTTNDDFFEEAESGVGSFSISMTDLNISTTYYVRAYAVTANGTVYGEQKTFTTRDGIPTLTTAEVTSIGSRWAYSGGIIADDGGLTITTRGVCWSVSPNPTLTNSHTTNGSGTGNFTSYISGLSLNTTYYVRAYATNSIVTVYGNQQSFTTESNVPTGAIDGLFSVSGSQHVYFSQGNLQYQASTNTWRFADNQYDKIGAANSNISSTYNGWIDLFGWGTSGWNNGNAYYHPWSSANNYYNASLYGPPGQYDLTGLFANADWGVYNPISNGGNTGNQWRTLTRSEWNYVFNTRATPSGIRYAKAEVNGVNGVILLPDDWNSNTYNLTNINNRGASFSSNTISSSQWAILENAGVVFLPAAGNRDGTWVNGVGGAGDYWSASCRNSHSAYCVYFSDSNLDMGAVDNNRYLGWSVRVVCTAE